MELTHIATKVVSCRPIQYKAHRHVNGQAVQLFSVQLWSINQWTIEAEEVTNS
jgi:hypothetical protein